MKYKDLKGLYNAFMDIHWCLTIRKKGKKSSSRQSEIIDYLLEGVLKKLNHIFLEDAKELSMLILHGNFKQAKGKINELEVFFNYYIKEINIATNVFSLKKFFKNALKILDYKNTLLEFHEVFRKMTNKKEMIAITSKYNEKIDNILSGFPPDVVELEKKTFKEIQDRYFKEVETLENELLSRLKGISINDSNLKESYKKAQAIMDDAEKLGLDKVKEEAREIAGMVNFYLKLKVLLKVGNRVSIDDLCRILDRDRGEVFKIITNLSDKAKFKIDGDHIIFTDVGMDSLFSSLDTAFADWSEKERTKEGKKE
ncbi:MAG: hypothetical protein ACTSYS_13805 [Promethearchaeota archaeon]